MEEQGFHLIDLFESGSRTINLMVPINIQFNHIKFQLGIDSVTNVSGALGGDLDPTKGMYWTWQNGYINFKLEGTSNLCPTRNHEFQFHLGGYQFPANALQTVLINAIPAEKINIQFDLKKFLEQVNLQVENQVMSPGINAVLLSRKATLAFSAEK